MNKLIGVYGTLRKGESNHRVLGNSEYVKTIRVNGFAMYGLSGFPAVIKGADEDSIVIEVYRIIDQKISNEIDLLEGFDRERPNSFDNFYTIQILNVNSIDESIEIYTFDHKPDMVQERGPKLRSGDWSKRNQSY